MKVKYDSNNSGGVWWLTDSQWKDLENNGWIVNWEKERWLGTLAGLATKEFESIKDAILDWEKITGLKSTEEGCNCCGAPHTFIWRDENHKEHRASGEGCLKYLFGENIPGNLREALEAK